ncbi:MAG: hypothetical protein HY716_03900 [Planctomycetes bacterium]|nr:hypothetical protein [Planctomycetota bacterium]
MSKIVKPLLPLQDLDLEIHRLRTLREEKPRELGGVEERVRRTQGNVEAIKEEIRTLRLEIQKREHLVRELDDKIAKLTNQSMGAKKNDEYQAFLKEISGVKADRARVEDGLLDLMFQADEKAKLEKVRAGELREAEASYAVMKQRVEAEIAELDRELAALEGRRAELLSGIEREILALYERILRVKEDGLALAPVAHYQAIEDEGARNYWGCGGCSVEVTAQMVNELRQGREVIFCRSCSRMLYWKDESPREPAESKP